VSTQATDYPRWVATLDTMLSRCSRAEQEQIYVRNAEKFYRL
jgi:predicted TIM-barrel fold metal-dependent hydrolase